MIVTVLQHALEKGVVLLLAIVEEDLQGVSVYQKSQTRSIKIFLMENLRNLKQNGIIKKVNKS